MRILANMTMKNTDTIKCEVCGCALPVNATVCPNCGMNLLLKKLIDNISPVMPIPEPSAVTTRDGQPKGDMPDELHQDEPAPIISPELAGDSLNRLDYEHDQVEIRQFQLDDSFVENVQAEERDPQSTETSFEPSQGLIDLVPAISQDDSLQRPRSHGFSRAWILSAILFAGMIFLFLGYLEKSSQLQAISSDHQNPQSTGSAQDERFRQAESTISAQQNLLLAQQNTIVAQQNSIIAQQTRPVNQNNPDMTLLFGPVDGILVHNNDGLIKTYWANQDLKNFILSVVVVNPYPSTFYSWDACIRFRRNYVDEYRLTIFSTQQWELTFGQSTEPIAGGVLTNLKTGEGESNTVYLDVQDSIASLKVNGLLVPTLDVSTYQVAGDIGIAIGSRKGDEVDGKTTVFKEFSLWEIH